VNLRLSVHYALTLLCVTLVLVISLGLGTLLTKNGWYIIPSSFGYLGLAVTITSALQAFSPKFRQKWWCKAIMLFDITALAELVRKKMIEVSGKGRKHRQDAMVYGTILFPLSVFWIAGIFFLGGTYVNTDSGTSVYISAMIDKLSIAQYFLLAMASFLLCMSILLIRYGFGKSGKWLGLKENEKT
jgi:hypothetical protein